ncbi:MAG: elongation factor G [Chloroflexi bacterium]|nr:elongation factor G [Chloroflexota bacterium]
MKTYPLAQLRNVALFGHGGAGKTTLAEAALFDAGAISRLGRVDDGTTVSDYDPEEVKRHISVQTSLLPFEWRGTKINLLDTPGYFDFVGEAREAVRVADAAVIIIDALGGVEVGTELTWSYADEFGLPRLVYINKMDRENADFERSFQQVRDRLDPRAVPLYLPIGAHERFAGVVDLVAMQARLGSKGEVGAVPDELVPTAEHWREKLIEAAAETDDELIAKYLEGEELSEAEIRAALRRAAGERRCTLVLAGGSAGNRGVTTLLDAIVDLLPSPAERGTVTATNAQTGEEVTLEPRADGPLAAFAFKTTADPYVGRLNYLRVCSGTLQSDSHVWNASKGREERIGQLFVVRGKTQEPVASLPAGDIGAVAKLQETTTGDTLATRELPLRLPGITFPQPVFSVAVDPKTKADLDKMSTGLARLVEEDPTLQVRRDPDTSETILAGMGESHLDVAVERLKRKFGVDVITRTPRIPYKETVLSATKAEYKHKKQTGGHGQYGHVLLELEPLPRGSGFEFGERVVGGVVPRGYIPAVEKGVREALVEGVLAGYPVVDLKVVLYDGSYHPVDSSEMAFKIASNQAFKKGVLQANPVLLEPIMNLTVTVPEEFMGDIMGDLTSKRARVLGMDSHGGFSVVRAQGPLSELQRYATDLRSMTGGRGTYTMDFNHYEEVPSHVVQTIIAEAKKRREET